MERRWKILLVINAVEMMEENIIHFIRQFVQLSDEDVACINKQNLFRSYRKNDQLLAEGERARECYFVIQGCVRAYYLKDGEERNTAFYLENETIRPLGYQTNQPSPYYLSCLEDCVLAVGSESRNKILVEQVPQLSSLILQMNETLLIQKTLELDDFKNHSPEERYLLLVEKQPALLNRIPLYHLASYLGITQISLSRIRRRLSKEKAS